MLLPLGGLLGLPGEPGGRREEMLEGMSMVQFIHSVLPFLLETGRVVRRSRTGSGLAVSVELV